MPSPINKRSATFILRLDKADKVPGWFHNKKAFKALKGEDQRSYLQSLACAQLGDPDQGHAPLSDSSIERLRRYYFRRGYADLKVKHLSDNPIAKRLSGLTDAIDGAELARRINAELPPSLTDPKVKRTPPANDDQLMFFVPNAVDAPLKDDVNLMDIAPFSLSKGKRVGVIRYQLKDCIITIEGGAEVGLANAYDYDIFLNMVTFLAEEMRRYRRDDRKGLTPSLPPLIYRPTAAQILKFCRRGDGGKQYAELEKALDRLQATRIKIVNLKDGKRRQTQSFPLINQYQVLSRTSQDRIEQVHIDVPRWVYEGIVNPSRKMSVLTLNPAYFLIAKPTARFLYRLARRAAGKDTAYYSVKDVHHRSGSTVPLRRFERALQKLVHECRSDPLPDYDLELKPGREGPVLKFTRREDVIETDDLFSDTDIDTHHVA